MQIYANFIRFMQIFLKKIMQIYANFMDPYANLCKSFIKFYANLCKFYGPILGGSKEHKTDGF